MRRYNITEKIKTRGLLRPLLSEDEVKAILNASQKILENGIMVKSDAALETFYGHGCHVDKKEQLVKIPPLLVESTIQSTPTHFLFAGRKPNRDIIIDEDCTYFSIASGAMNYVDSTTHLYRVAIKRDIVDCIRLVDALDEISIANRAMVLTKVFGQIS